MTRYLLFLLFLWLTVPMQAQIDSLETEEYTEDAELQEDEPAVPYKAPPIAPVAMREIKEDDWENAAKNLDYSKDQPKPPKPPKDPSNRRPLVPDFDWSGISNGAGSFLQVLAILFALFGIGYGIYRMMQTPQNRVIAADGTEITLANLEDYIHETDLERFLREALAASNWPLAVRLYFLQCIKSLSEKQAITWSKEKTNRDYLREMSAHRLSQHFRELTREYERVWYGNQGLSKSRFEELQSAFKAFLSQL